MTVTITNNTPSYPGHSLTEFGNEGAFAVIKADGSVVAWGDSTYGGNSSAVAAQLNGTVDVKQIFSTKFAFAALRTDGSVVTWGNSLYGGSSTNVAAKLDGTVDVKQVSSTFGAFAALRDDGSVVTWGSAGNGGNSQAVAGQIGSQVAQVFSTYSAFAALRADGSVVTWGSSGGGDSGAVAAQLNGTVDVSQIFSTGSAFAALRKDGSVVTWGVARWGADSSAVAAQINGTQDSVDVVKIFSTQGAFAALRKDGSVVSWGDAGYGGNSNTVATQINGSVDVTSVTSTASAFAALRTDGSVVTWGADGGDSSAVAGQIDGKQNALDVEKVFSTNGAFAALRKDGSVVSWGNPGNGGNSGAVAAKLDGTVDVIQIYATDSAFAALRADGSVVTWGSNGGDSSAVAAKLDGTVDVKQIFATFGAFAALRVDGSVVTWGDAADGGNSTAVASLINAGVVSGANVDTDDVFLSSNRTPTGIVSYSGIAAVGQTLTAFNSLVDADGLGTISYTWIVGGKVVGVGKTYTPTNSDVGWALTVQASYTDKGGTAESVLGGNALVGATFQGTIRRDTMVGTSGNDLLRGLGGDDRLDGRQGADKLVGGDGNDTYIVDNTGDIVEESDSAKNSWGDQVDSYLGYYALPDNVEHLYIKRDGGSGSGNELANALYGGVGNDVLRGLGGDDYLDGGQGVDKLIGGDGNDYYVVDNPNDIVSETNASLDVGGDDVVDSYAASYALGANVENLRILASGAANGTGNGLDNVVDAGAGNNVLDGGAGNDTVTYSYASKGVIASLAITGIQNTVGSGVDTLRNFENLYGSDFSDWLMGNGADNELFGGEGNDYLDGERGADRLLGWNGNDVYVVDNIGDVVIEAGGGTDRVESYLANYTLGATVENLRILATGPANGTGNGLANVIYAGTGNNALDGGADGDTVSYFYASNAITASLATTVAQNTGGSGRDTLRNFENIEGSHYNDTLTGNAGNNTLSGGNGIDLLDGKQGADRLVGGAGNDVYVVDNSGDFVVEAATGGTDYVRSYLASYILAANLENLDILATGAANGTGNQLSNVIYAGAGNNALDGGAGVDTLSYFHATKAVSVSLATTAAQTTGGSGKDALRNFENLEGSLYSDTLVGNAGNNTLSGDLGNDRLVGSSASDTLWGGMGADIFAYLNTADSGISVSLRDTIRDFHSSERDKIDLSQLDASSALSGNQTFTTLNQGSGFSGKFNAQASLYFDKTAHVLYGNNDADSNADFAIMLTGVSSLAKTDFIL